MTPMRPARTIAGVAGAIVALAGCGGSADSGYGCTGDTCTASFDGPGSQDLSHELGSGSRVEIKSVEGMAVAVAVGDDKRTLRRGQRATLGHVLVRVTEVDGSKVKLRLEKAA